MQPSDRETILAGLDHDVLLSLEPPEVVLATNIITFLAAQHGGGKAGTYHDITNELQYMLATGQKFEIEALATLDEDHSTLIEYLKMKIGHIISHPSLAGL